MQQPPLGLEESPEADLIRLYTPKGIRTPVASVKGMCPRPLDDGGALRQGDPNPKEG